MQLKPAADDMNVMRPSTNPAWDHGGWGKLTFLKRRVYEIPCNWKVYCDKLRIIIIISLGYFCLLVKMPRFFVCVSNLFAITLLMFCGFCQLFRWWLPHPITPQRLKRRIRYVVIHDRFASVLVHSKMQVQGKHEF
jgi:hypothetical protein